MGDRRCAVVALLLTLASACALRAEAPPSDAATSHHDFADVAHWSSVFDDPARDAWQKPQELVAALAKAGLANAEIEIEIVNALERHRETGKLRRFIPLQKS